MHFDQDAFQLALAQERVKLGLPPNGPSEPGLKLAAGGRIIHFDPKLHPRDPLGRFREVLDKLDDAKDSTQRVNMPGGGYVEKKGGKYRVAKKGVGDVEYDDKEQVVETLRRAAGLKEVDKDPFNPDAADKERKKAGIGSKGQSSGKKSDEDDLNTREGIEDLVKNNFEALKRDHDASWQDFIEAEQAGFDLFHALDIDAEWTKDGKIKMKDGTILDPADFIPDAKPDKPKRIGPERPAPGKPSDPHAGKGRTAWKEKARARILDHENGKEILDSLDDDALDEAFDDGKSPHKWARDQIEAFEKKNAAIDAWLEEIGFSPDAGDSIARAEDEDGIHLIVTLRGRGKKQKSFKLSQDTKFDYDAFQVALAQERADRGLSIIDEARAGGSGAPKPVIEGIKKKLGGELTEESIREFQEKHGLQVDGVIGHQTASAILGDGKAKVGPLTKKDKRRLFITLRGE